MRRAIAVGLLLLFLLLTLALFGDVARVIRNPTGPNMLSKPGFWLVYGMLGYSAFGQMHASWFKGRAWVGGIAGLVFTLATGWSCTAFLQSEAEKWGRLAEQTRRQGEEKLEKAIGGLQPVLAAAVAFDPTARIPTAQDLLEAAKRGEFDEERDGGVILAEIEGVTSRALARTSEGALLEYLKTYAAALDDVAAVSVEDCVAVFSGGGGFQARKREADSVQPSGRAAMTAALVRVLTEATGRPPERTATAREVETLMGLMAPALKASKVDIELLRAGANVDARARCEAYRALLHETLRLPEPGRSRLARTILLGQ
jgi:hypothetical protein